MYKNIPFCHSRDLGFWELEKTESIMHSNNNGNSRISRKNVFGSNWNVKCLSGYRGMDLNFHFWKIPDLLYISNFYSNNSISYSQTYSQYAMFLCVIINKYNKYWEKYVDYSILKWLNSIMNFIWMCEITSEFESASCMRLVQNYFGS